MPGRTLWDIEAGFWLDGPHFFEAHMAADAMMVFPAPVGILQGIRIVEALEGVPRWADIDMSEQTERAEMDVGLRILAYRAVATREDADPYEAYCTSTYRHSVDGWVMVLHQQTPVG